MGWSAKHSHHMSAAERRMRLSGERPVIEGREEFVRENAMVLLRERDSYIGRLRHAVRILERKVRGLADERARHWCCIAKLQAAQLQMAERDNELHDEKDGLLADLRASRLRLARLLRWYRGHTWPEGMGKSLLPHEVLEVEAEARRIVKGG